MDKLKKALAEEKKVYKDLLVNFDICCSECGEALFKYREEIADEAPYIADDYFGKWQTARENRDAHTQTILTIKTAVTRQNELKKFIAEVDKVFHEYTVNQKKAASAFSILFVKTYYEVSPHYFTDISADAEPLQAQIKNLEYEQIALENQKNTANFLQKISLNAQLTVLKAKYTAVQKKLEKVVVPLSESLLHDSRIVDLYTNGQLQNDLALLYEQFCEYTDKIAEAENRKAVLAEENTAIEANLALCGVSDNPQSRITELTQCIKDIDTTITTTEKEQGLYAGQICYPETDAHNTAVLPHNKNIQAYIESVHEQSIALKKQQRAITLLENELAMSEETARIDNLKKAIVQYERSITEYQRMIEKAQNDIIHAEDKKLQLQNANEALKSEVA